MDDHKTKGYHFPPITVNKGNILAQISKIVEEAGECFTAAADYTAQPDSETFLQALCEEAWDALQAAETLVRQLKQKHPATMAAAKYLVYAKCHDRGYYKEVKK